MYPHSLQNYKFKKLHIISVQKDSYLKQITAEFSGLKNVCLESQKERKINKISCYVTVTNLDNLLYFIKPFISVTNKV